MPARTDHDRRDAQHAARATIAIAMGRYIRRLTEAAYAHIEEEATGELGDTEVDWSAVGAAAANRALNFYGVTTIAPPVEGTAALVAGADPEDDPANA